MAAFCLIWNVYHNLTATFTSVGRSIGIIFSTTSEKSLKNRWQVCEKFRLPPAASCYFEPWVNSKFCVCALIYIISVHVLVAMFLKTSVHASEQHDIHWFLLLVNIISMWSLWFSNFQPSWIEKRLHLLLGLNSGSFYIK